MTVCLMCKGKPDDVDEAAVQYICSRCVAQLVRMGSEQIKLLHEKCLAHGWREKADYLSEQFNIAKEEGINVREAIKRRNTGRGTSGDSGSQQDGAVQPKKKRVAVRTSGSGKKGVRRKFNSRVADKKPRKQRQLQLDFEDCPF